MSLTPNMRNVRAALQYWMMGLPIVPLCSHDHVGESPAHVAKCTSPGKTPVIKGWTKPEYWTSLNQNSILHWFKSNPSRNIGLVLGSASGFIGVDIDGELGEMYMGQWSKGDLPQTVEYVTSNNGRRLLYRIPPGLKTRKAVVFTNDDIEHTEVALLGQGQQTVLPPSIHKSGFVYDYTQQGSFTNYTRTGDDGKPYIDLGLIPYAPRWMQNEMNAARKQNDTREWSDTVEQNEWRQHISQGGRHNALLRLAGSLVKNYIDDPLFTKQDAIETMLKHNQQYFIPSLNDDEVIQAVNDIWTHEGTRGNEKKNFVPVSVAAQFLHFLERSDEHIRYLEAEDIFYRYEHTGPRMGVWVPITFTTLSKTVRDYISARNKSWAVSSKIQEILNIVKETLCEDYPESRFIFDLGTPERARWLAQENKSPSDWIAVKNGMLEWKTGILRPHGPQFYALSKLSADYVPEATCPFWESALVEWLPRPEDRKFVQRFAGTLLVPDKIDSVVYFIGEGANGKSKLAETLASVIDEKSMVRLNLGQLTERFALYNLKNKVLNLCTDDSTKYISDTGTLKAAMIGEPVQVEIKMQQGRPLIHPVAKFLICSNSFPLTGDKSFGWLRRLTFIKFERNFLSEYTPKQRYTFEQKLENSMEAEASGRLNWFIEGLRRFKEEHSKLPNAYTPTDSDMSTEESIRVDPEQTVLEQYKGDKARIETLLDYQSVNDDVARFTQELIVPLTNKEKTQQSIGAMWISTTALYELYHLWCSEIQRQRKIISKRQFNTRLRSLGYTISPRRIEETTTGKTTSVQAILDIRLNTEHEDIEEMYKSSVMMSQLPNYKRGTGFIMELPKRLAN